MSVKGKLRSARALWREVRDPPLITRNESLKRERIKALVSTPCPAPVFIFGLQKSGTSAICGLLGEATGERTQIDFEGAWEPYMSRLVRGETGTRAFVRRNAWAFSARIIKEPCLTLAAPELMAHFPAARAIFVVREPASNIQSILNRLKIPGHLAELGGDAPPLPNDTWRCLLGGADLGYGGQSHIEALALRWSRAAETYLAQPERYVLVRYEDFLADKTGAIEGLAAAVGLEATRPIDHLLDVQFQPAAKVRSAPAEFFGERNLEIITRLTGPAAERLGYA
ncbi:sulfotransferase family protein [Pseudoroseicyclus tamaricis]|uniref:Sulfotransferase n=1 Tax=Pseudoroseicyclus tamaricis TaxID=2705421 RepID=A0A6B2JIW9_9RHOB|nr:sulfotransferase [Pseudoroseicyclus tamaricis]NDV01353.1 sulfotransferase [Pseudoroseicyclus tamaricis]